MKYNEFCELEHKLFNKHNLKFNIDVYNFKIFNDLLSVSDFRFTNNIEKIIENLDESKCVEIIENCIDFARI